MNTQQERRCVLYARLSVTKEESVSIARQLQSCRRYAEARGWEVVGEFIDDGVSATANRPEDRNGWASLLATTDFDAVIIWKVDRLARRVLDFLHADEALQKRGAGLVAVEDPIDMTSPQGRAFAVMLAVFGEMEAEAIRARVRAARAQLLKGRRKGWRRHNGTMTASRIPPIQCLLTFEALARLRSVTQTSEELCVTPSAVSHRVKQLEQIIGTKLFGRADFSLTTEGSEYLAHVREGLANLQKFPVSAAAPGKRKLRLAVTPTFSRSILIPRLRIWNWRKPRAS